MSNPALARGALAKPEPRKRIKARGQRRKADADKVVYTHVEVRDWLHCRACRAYAGVDAHRHHLKGRKFTTIHDVCILCPDCHDLMHVRVGGKLMKLYGDANLRNEHGALCGLTLETRNNDGTWRTEEGL